MNNVKDTGMKADQTISVQDFIAMSSSDDVTYFNYSVLEHLDGYDMFITNILYDYEQELKELAVTVTLTDLERAKYRYKPYLLAYDLYGSVETKFILMMINSIIDPKEFDFQKVKVISRGNLTTILNRIESVEENYKSKIKSRLRTERALSDGNNIWTE